MIHNDSDYQTFLKIISWEDFFRHCGHRMTFEDNCFCREIPELEPDKLCEEPDKKTMLKCPVWKTLRNFYSGRTWQKIKEGEINHGRDHQEEKCKITQGHKRNERQQNRPKGRFRTETF